MNPTHYIRTGDDTVSTTATSNPATVNDWIINVTNSFRSHHKVIFGLDIEWKPNWGSGQDNPPATLQICAGTRCLIIQLIYISHFPGSLVGFLRNPRHVFAGLGISEDAEKLNRVCGLLIGTLYDVREAALGTAPERISRWPGLRELAREVANVRIEKPKRITMSDWSMPVLSGEQVEYACLDAYASFRVGFILYFNLQWEPQFPSPINMSLEQQERDFKTQDQSEHLQRLEARLAAWKF